MSSVRALEIISRNIYFLSAKKTGTIHCKRFWNKQQV